MRKAFKITIMLLVLLSLLCAGAAAESTPSVLEISNIFVYDQPVEGADQNPEVSLAANVRYREKIAALAETIDFTQESETLRFCTKQALAQDDFTALTWQVTNRTDKTLYVSGSEFDADFSGVEYDLCGGLNQFNYVLHPGETLDARFHGWLWEHVEPGEGTLQLKLRVYELTGDGLNGALDAASIEESGMPLLENVAFRVSMEMKQGAVCSALAEGQPLLRSMNGYTLKVTRADMGTLGMEIALERVYDTKEAAVADPGAGDSYWEYSLPAADGSMWIHVYYGMIPDEPEENADGTWSWHYSGKVYYMFSQPDTIVLRSVRYDTANGYDWANAEDAALSFVLDGETR